MNSLNDFFTSENWREISTRMFSSLFLTGVSVASNASVSTSVNDEIQSLDYLMQIVSISSGVMAALASLTVIVRFILWLKDRKKNTKL